MSANNGIPERLKEARIALKYTQTRMGEAVGGKLRSWQEYEAGKRMPGGHVFEGLAALGINVNWILTGEGPKLISDLGGPPSEAEQSTGSGASPDFALVAEVLDVITEVLSERQLELPFDKRVQLAHYLYKEFLNSQTKPTRGKVIELVRLVS